MLSVKLSKAVLKGIHKSDELMCFESKTLNSLKSLVDIALISVDDFLSSSVLDSEFLQEKIKRKVKINRNDFMINIFIKNTKNRTLI
ncbi:hypothetical protein GCM10011531_23730 [Aquaticitalea lipolytica]|uniref:Uncharacterized protein n=1 Tax=Aquaticitalea lipolytica TaxID=1247562 RepID=A0A8J2XGY8_9FLAO|nr:hypothetical protein GCM10011531_23730 [Aquaticitalea lipolytica]